MVDGSPPPPAGFTDLKPAAVRVHADVQGASGFVHPFGSAAPLSDRNVQRFMAAHPDLCGGLVYEGGPVDAGWALAYQEWADRQETQASKQTEKLAEARRKEAEATAKRLERDRARVEKWNREAAAASAREREDARSRVREEYERRAAGKA